jgi:hypothetical protein
MTDSEPTLGTKDLNPPFDRDSYDTATLNVKRTDNTLEITVRFGLVGIVDAYIELNNPGVVIIDEISVEEGARRGVGAALLARTLEAAKAKGAIIADFEAITDRRMIGIIERLVKAGIIKSASFIVARSDDTSPPDIDHMRATDILADPRRTTAAEVKSIPRIAEEGGVRLRAAAIL